MTPAVTPNRGGPTERAPKEENLELRNSMFSDVRQKHTEHIFLRECLKNPSVESVSDDQTRLSPKDVLLPFTSVHVLPGCEYFLADCMCRFRTRSRMFAFGCLALAWEWLERTLGALKL